MWAGGCNVLVISGQSAETEVLLRHLRRWGYSVHLAVSGEQGLALMQQLKPKLILCQLDVAGIDGYQVLESIAMNAETRDLPFFFMNHEWTMANWSRPAGGRTADCHLRTPLSRIDLGGLKELTRRVLEA